MTLSYRLDGPEDAPLLVLTPSLGTTMAVFWDGVLPAFAEQFRVLRHDLPGHGESPLPDGPVRIEDIGRGVLELVDEVGAARFSFCGVSIGGMTGQWLGANAGDRIDRLALCQNRLEIILGKNRSGPTATLDLWCDVAASSIAQQARGPV